MKISQYLRRRYRDLWGFTHQIPLTVTPGANRGCLSSLQRCCHCRGAVTAHIPFPFVKMPLITKYGVRIVCQWKLRFLSLKSFSYFSHNSHFEIRSNVFIQICGTKLITVLTTGFFRKNQRWLRAEDLATVQLWVRAGPPMHGRGSVGRRRRNTADAS